MKRFFSFMMSLVLVLSLGVTAFAAPGTNGSITITNATVGENYSVYKIFDATYKDTSVTYTINPGDEFFDNLFGADGSGENDYFEYHASTGVVTRTVDGEGKYVKTDAELFQYLSDLVEDAAVTVSEKAISGTLIFEGLTTGYYVIKRTNGTTNGVTITTAKPNAEVHDKNQTSGNLEKKIWDEDKNEWVEVSSANVGDVVNFKVEFPATNYNDGKKVEEYTFSDALSSAWANIDTNSIQVKVGDKTLAVGDFTVTPTVTSNVTTGFTLEIPWVNSDEDKTFKYASPVDVEVTYSATVLEAAASADPATKDNKNHVTSNWDSEGDNTTTKVYNMGFTKVDGTDATKTLAGAKFNLYSNAECTVPVNVKSTGTGGVYMVDPDGTSNEVVTPADGQVVIMGLEAGTYYLKETVPPAGYNLLPDAKPVNVGGTNSGTMKINGTDYTVNNAVLNIENNTGVVLPSTGGEGTMKMITIGTIVAMAFAVLLITHKKMTIYQD